MKGTRIEVVLDNAPTAVMAYGNLALLNVGKLPENGRQVNAYMIVHVPTKMAAAGPIRGQKEAKEALQLMLAVDDWNFNSIDELTPARALLLVGKVRSVDREEEERCRKRDEEDSNSDSD